VTRIVNDVDIDDSIIDRTTGRSTGSTMIGTCQRVIVLPVHCRGGHAQMITNMNIRSAASSRRPRPGPGPAVIAIADVAFAIGITVGIGVAVGGGVGSTPLLVLIRMLVLLLLLLIPTMIPTRRRML
jgi:hypothetical protein